MKEISSTQNPLVKDVALLLEKARVRRSRGLFVCEGLNEINLLLRANYEIREFLFCPDIISRAALNEHFGQLPELELTTVSRLVMGKISYRADVKNAVVVAVTQTHALQELKLREDALILVLEKVEKPGNLGAILRSADAAGVDAVVICDEGCDLYNPNVIRSSVGCVFTTKIAVSTVNACQEFLFNNSFNIYSTFMKDAQNIYAQDLRGKTALVFGTESEGLSEQWDRDGIVNVNIPMHGRVDSLNVSNAAAIMVFEAVRQRSK